MDLLFHIYPTTESETSIRNLVFQIIQFNGTKKAFLILLEEEEERRLSKSHQY